MPNISLYRAHGYNQIIFLNLTIIYKKKIRNWKIVGYHFYLEINLVLVFFSKENMFAFNK